MESPAPEAAAASPSDTNPADAQDLNSDETPKSSPPAVAERIQKAESFLRNNEISNIPTTAKREFLEKNVGFTRDEIDMAMERVAKREGLGRDDTRDGQIHDDRFRGQGPRRRYEDEHLDGRYQYGDRDRRMIDRGGPYETTNQPYYNSNNMAMNSYATHGLPPDQMDELRDKQGFSFTSWAGGFSLGVFCLAALRWLNGGDFVLFPPPTAADRETKTDGQLNESNVDAIGEETEDEASSFLGIIEEEGEEEDDQDVDDEALSSILNGTSNAQHHHPTDWQPSYEDLVLEIRALTSAVNSYREEQERANRAAVAQVGRGVTDDVMDFLRVDKNKSKSSESAILQSDVENASLLLKEISEELTLLKQNFGKGEDKGVDDNEVSKAEGESDQDNLLSRVDGLTIKLQKAIDCITPTPSADVDQSVMSEETLTQKLPPPPPENADADTNVESATESGAASELEQPTNQELLAQSAEQTPSSTNADSTDELKEALQSTVENGSTRPEPLNQLNSTSQNVEQALRTLASDNSEDKLKIGAQMLYLYCMNISKNPTVPRYRKIYTNNSTFQKKVGNLSGAEDLLCAVGFAKKANFFEYEQPNGHSPETQSSLDLALVALDMMRKSNAIEKETQNMETDATISKEE